jgi:hypothetical protein
MCRRVHFGGEEPEIVCYNLYGVVYGKAQIFFGSCLSSTTMLW